MSLIQHRHGGFASASLGTGTYTMTLAFTSPLTAGSTLIIALIANGTTAGGSITTPVITDSLGNSYTQVFWNDSGNASGGSVGLYKCEGSLAGASTVTFSVHIGKLFSTVSNLGLVLAEYTAFVSTVQATVIQGVYGVAGNAPVPVTFTDSHGATVTVTWTGIFGSGGPGTICSLGVADLLSSGADLLFAVMNNTVSAPPDNVAPTVSGAYSVFIKHDEGLTPGTGDPVIVYFDSTLSISCASPPSGIVGIAYSHAFPGSGGAPGYTFAIVSGSLPTGLSLNASTGVVSGTPTLDGTFPFVIGITDADATTASVSCSITIGAHAWLVINEPSVGFTDRSGYLDENNPASYTLQQGSRSTASVGLVIHHGDTYAATLGTQMFLYEFVQGGDPNGYCVFAGTIDTIEITWDGDRGDRRALLTGVSFEQIFDVILIPTTTHLGQTTDFIVHWILDNYCSGQPLIIGTIDAGPVIDFFTIDFESASDVFTRLAKIAGCIWGVDPTYGGIFYFTAPPAVVSPFTLASNEVLWETMDWQWNRQDFRDGQSIRIPFEAFLPTFVSFAGNGATTIFSLPYRIEKLTHALLTAGTQATGTGTFTGNAANGDTITIGDGVYVFNTVLDNTLITRVKIGATAADTLSNFVDAINADPAPGKPGVTYSLPTWHHDAESATASGLTITVKSGYPGTVGNGNPLSDTCANFSWSAGATAGGTDADKKDLSFVVISADAAQSDVYYTVGVNTVNCLVAPPVGKNLIIGYYRQGADVITVEDSALVTTRAAIEHSTGRYQQITQDSNQLDAQAALTAVRATLAAYKQIPKTFQFTTDNPGLSTGQTLSIALQENPAGTPALIDGDYLIQEVNGELVPGIQYIGPAKGHFRYTVHVISATVGTYAEFWLGLASGGSSGGSGGGSAGFANAATTGGGPGVAAGTVTHTAGALTAHLVVIGNGAADIETPVAIGSAGQFLESAGAGADPVFASVTDALLVTSNITTNNVTIAKHGFVPILPNDATKFLDGTGAYTVPPGAGGGAPATSQYVLGVADGALANARVNSAAYMGPDAAAASPNAMDDEFDGGSLNARWAWVNQGSSTISFASSIGTLVPQIVGGADNLVMIAQPVPTAPWEVTARFSWIQKGLTNSKFGLGLYDGTKFIPFVVGMQTSNFTLAVYRFTNSSSFSSTPYTQNLTASGNLSGHAWVYLKIRDDGANLIYSIGIDGVNFITYLSESRTAFMTATKVGLLAEMTSAGEIGWIACDWFRRTL